MEDWQWNAEQFNIMGAKVKAAGFSWISQSLPGVPAQKNGKVPLDEIIRLTDPGAGNVRAGLRMGDGGRRRSRRLPEAVSDADLHAPRQGLQEDERADVAGTGREAADLGHGTADYKTIFAAADKGQIKHYFVEQE